MTRQLSDRERALLGRIARLEQRMAMLESKLNAPSTPQPFESSAPGSASTGAATVTPTTTAQTAAQANARIPGFPAGTTMNLYFHGHYGWNSNQPAGRVNLPRANEKLDSCGFEHGEMRGLL